MRTVKNITSTFPSNKEENYVNGNIEFEDGVNIAFQIPAEFNEDGTLNEAATNNKIEKAIQMMTQGGPIGISPSFNPTGA